jgi:hypothetical protein
MGAGCFLNCRRSAEPLASFHNEMEGCRRGNAFLTRAL